MSTIHSPARLAALAGQAGLTGIISPAPVTTIVTFVQRTKMRKIQSKDAKANLSAVVNEAVNGELEGAREDNHGRISLV
jgi:hypothetical protein